MGPIKRRQFTVETQGKRKEMTTSVTLSQLNNCVPQLWLGHGIPIASKRLLICPAGEIAWLWDHSLRYPQTTLSRIQNFVELAELIYGFENLSGLVVYFGEILSSLPC